MASDSESEIRLGTSAFTAAGWEGTFYPAGMKPAEFLAEYTVESEEEGRILRRSEAEGCVFLDGKTCTVYEARPDTCSRFPHLVRGNGSIASRMWQFIDRACYCPIVYNSLEAFKEETGFTR